MTPEAAEAAANAAGLTKDKFDQLATSVNSIPGSKAIDVNAHTEPAKNSLTDLGMTVAKLPNGEIKIDGDNTQHSPPSRRSTASKWIRTPVSSPWTKASTTPPSHWRTERRSIRRPVI